MVLSIFFCFLFIPLVGATSGACSTRGGVDCSAGADSDESVICTDGWRNSSVPYASMAQCSVYHEIPSADPVVSPSNDLVAQPIPAPNDSFTDVNGTTPFYDSIEFLKAKNIISGDPAGTFRPFDILNRAELLRIVATAQYPMIDESYNQNCFNDIQGDQWYTKVICFSKTQGFIGGYGDNTFRPGQGVTYAEGIKMALEMFGQKPAEKTEVWYDAYINKAIILGVHVEGSLPNEKLSRAKAAEIVARLVKKFL